MTARVAIVWLLLASSVFIPAGGVCLAHEPIFGLGAHTLFKGGYGQELEFEQDEAGNEKSDKFTYHLSYGVTADFTIGLAVPGFVEKRLDDATSSGLGDLSLRAKYRFIRLDEPGSTTGVALNLAIKLPSGDETDDPPTGSGSADYMIGLAVSSEGLVNYFFTDVRYVIMTEANDVRRGNLFFFDIAYGIRPLAADYLKPDLVSLLEVNLEHEDRTISNNMRLDSTGGVRVFVSPGFLLSYRNVMAKGGIQLPVSQNLHGDQEKTDFRALLSIEVHL